jgi:hypothetical protein
MRMNLRCSALMLAAALGVGACGSSASTATPPSTTTEATTTTAAPTESADLCVIFGKLAANRGGRDAQAEPSTAEGWNTRIEITGQIVDTAPAEWKDEAETYLAMVKDRAEFAADSGYVAVDDLPADVRNAFIADHREMQAEVDTLIAFMGSECGQ